MNKKILLAIIIVCIMVACVAGAICSSKQNYYIHQMELVSSYTGYGNLGVIDSYEISSRNGAIYDRQAIVDVLCERAGISSDCDVVIDKVMDCEESLSIWHLKVYKNDKRTVMNFLYGDIC